MDYRKKIISIGDSHADFFSGWDSIGPEYPEMRKGRFSFFQSFRLGPTLAYNLCKTGTQTRGREKLFEILGKINPLEAKILLCFGEIDCRAHLLKQSRQKNIPVEDIVKDCVHRYFGVIKEIRSMGFEVIVWNVIPSSAYENFDPKFPTVGNCAERNNVSKLFNRELKKLCDENQIKLISIFDRLIDEKGLTKMKYYMDKVHLSQKAMPLALEEFKKQINDIDFSITFKNRIDLLKSKLNKNRLKKFLRGIRVKLRDRFKKIN